MISNNMCYSTILGSVEEIVQENGKVRLGVANPMNVHFSQVFPNPDIDISELREKLFVSPNKIAFLKKTVRQGIIPSILSEFLMTRIMIKQSIPLVNQTKEHLKMTL